jgi:uncharacterized DUF497 family protein
MKSFWLTNAAAKIIIKAWQINIIFFCRGHIDHEDIYAAYTQIHNGRYLIVFFINKKGNSALPISARDMDNKKRRYYENQKRSKKKY